jgi:hypothetical protein
MRFAQGFVERGYVAERGVEHDDIKGAAREGHMAGVALLEVQIRDPFA